MRLSPGASRARLQALRVRSQRPRWSVAAGAILSLGAGVAAVPATAAPWSDEPPLCERCGHEPSADLAMAADGRAVVGWLMRERRAVTSRAPGGAASTLTVATGRQDRDHQTTAAIGEGGNAVVAWGIDPIEARIRGRGGAWGPSEEIGNGAHPDAAIAPSGTIYVAMAAGRIGKGVQVARRALGEGWSLEQVPSGVNGHLPHLALNDDLAVVLWESREGDRRVLSSVRREGTWQPAEAFPGGEGLSVVPTLTLDHRGNALAVWSGTAGVAGSGVFASHRSPFGTWSAPQRLDTGPSANVPQVAFDRVGNALATWLGGGEADGAVTVRAARFDAFAKAWDKPVDIARTTTRRPPRLGVGPTGQAVVVWADQPLPRAARGSSLTGRFERSEPVGSETGRGVREVEGVGVDREGRALALWEEGGSVGFKGLRVARRAAGGAGEIRLTPGQLLINQRIAQAAVRRTNAALAALDAGLPAAALREGGLLGRAFGENVTLAGAPAGEERAPGERYRVPVPAPSAGGQAKVEVSAAQLRIGQRIAQAALRRANALTAHLAAGLTGRDLAEGAVTASKLAPGLTVAATSAPPSPGPAIVIPSPGAGGGAVRLSAAQLAVNQRISQAAVRRSNFAIALLESGLSDADFAPGSLSARELTADLR